MQSLNMSWLIHLILSSSAPVPPGSNFRHGHCFATSSITKHRARLSPHRLYSHSCHERQEPSSCLEMCWPMICFYIYIYIKIQVVPGQAGGGSFKFETLIAYRAEGKAVPIGARQAACASQQQSLEFQSDATSFECWIFSHFICSHRIAASLWKLLTASHCHHSLCHPISSQLVSCLLSFFSPHLTLIPSHVFSPILSSFSADHDCSLLFTCHLSFSHLFSSQLLPAFFRFTQLFSTLLISPQLMSAHLTSSHLLFPLLTSSKLFSNLLSWSQLLSARHTSSQRFSAHYQIISALL